MSNKRITPDNINAANTAFWERRNQGIAKLVNKKPTPADIKAGELRTVRRVLDEAEKDRQTNEPKLRRLIARLGNTIDDSNIPAYRAARRLLKESNAPARLRLALAKAAKQTRAAVSSRRNIGNATRERVLKAVSGEGSLRSKAEAVAAIISPEHARKILAERIKK